MKSDQNSLGAAETKSNGLRGCPTNGTNALCNAVVIAKPATTPYIPDRIKIGFWPILLSSSLDSIPFVCS
jgi:hypothetical protein